MTTGRLFSYDTLGHAVAGAAGGLTAMTVFYPLDIVRSRLQVEECREAKNTFLVMKDLIETEGMQSLYRGIRPVLQSLCCSNFVYFYAFHGLRSAVHYENHAHKAVRDLFMSSIAGVINVFLTTPLWVANSRIKMQGAKLAKEEMIEHQKYDGLIDALIKICKHEGWQALWSSLVPSLMLVINPAIQFTIYETLKSRIMERLNTKELGVLVYFLLGAMSKSCATVLTYPLQMIQSKLRYGSDALKKKNVLQIILHIVRCNGVKGLFKGLEAKLLQTVLTAALMFLVYEKIAAFVFLIMKVQKQVS